MRRQPSASRPNRATPASPTSALLAEEDLSYPIASPERRQTQLALRDGCHDAGLQNVGLIYASDLMILG